MITQNLKHIYSLKNMVSLGEHGLYYSLRWMIGLEENGPELFQGATMFP
jgi:hypothetical protein